MSETYPHLKRILAHSNLNVVWSLHISRMYIVNAMLSVALMQVSGLHLNVSRLTVIALLIPFIALPILT